MSTTATPLPRPSSSVLLVSPTNHVILLHRVRQSRNFPSAHVFPGGTLDPFHDGPVPAPSSPARHTDGPPYRLAAIRETFEESGVLLARNAGFGRLVEVGARERTEGRRKVHAKEVEFETWLAGQGGRPDVEGLVPFTRWITPVVRESQKRFSTQMYVYFLPLPGPTSGAAGAGDGKDGSGVDAVAATASEKETPIPPPTPDGGLEHTSALFLHAGRWLDMARRGEIIVFPPQFFLLGLVGEYLPTPSSGQVFGVEELKRQRGALRDFIKKGAWGEKVICPMFVGMQGKRRILSLHDPGEEEELRRRGVRGEWERVVLAEFKREGPRDVEVRWRGDVERDVGRVLVGGESKEVKL